MAIRTVCGFWVGNSTHYEYVDRSQNLQVCKLNIFDRSPTRLRLLALFCRYEKRAKSNLLNNRMQKGLSDFNQNNERTNERMAFVFCALLLLRICLHTRRGTQNLCSECLVSYVCIIHCDNIFPCDATGCVTSHECESSIHIYDGS